MRLDHAGPSCPLLVAILIACTIPVRTDAQVTRLSIEDLGDLAETVVRGSVVSERPFWNDSRTKIFTEIVVAAEQTYKGQAASTVRVLQLGGEVDGVRVTVHGALAWTPGDEVLLFLERYRGGRHVVTGLSQGRFDITRDEATGEIFVSRGGVARATAEGDGASSTTGTSVPRTSLASFLEQALGDRPARSRDDSGRR